MYFVEFFLRVVVWWLLEFDLLLYYFEKNIKNDYSLVACYCFYDT